MRLYESAETSVYPKVQDIPLSATIFLRGCKGLDKKAMAKLKEWLIASGFRE